MMHSTKHKACFTMAGLVSPRKTKWRITSKCKMCMYVWNRHLNATKRYCTAEIQKLQNVWCWTRAKKYFYKVHKTVMKRATQNCWEKLFNLTFVYLVQCMKAKWCSLQYFKNYSLPRPFLCFIVVVCFVHCFVWWLTLAWPQFSLDAGWRTHSFLRSGELVGQLCFREKQLSSLSSIICG